MCEEREVRKKGGGVVEGKKYALSDDTDFSPIESNFSAKIVFRLSSDEDRG